jgi:hypothetical protein
MAWAAYRTTTRSEDRAYSLLGLFDINIPLLYGEGGKRAFRRLQEAIAQDTLDHSLLVWDGANTNATWENSILAPSPECFVSSRHVANLRAHKLPMSFTSTGLQMSLPVVAIGADSRWCERFYALLDCRFEHDVMKTIALPLGKVHQSSQDVRLIARSKHRTYVVVHTERILERPWIGFLLLERPPTLGQAGLPVVETTTGSWIYTVPNPGGSSPRCYNFRPLSAWNQDDLDTAFDYKFEYLKQAVMVPASELSGRFWVAFDVVLERFNVFMPVCIVSDGNKCLVHLTKFQPLSELQKNPRRQTVKADDHSTDYEEGIEHYRRLSGLTDSVKYRTAPLPNSRSHLAVQIIDKYFPYEPVRMIYVSLDLGGGEGAPDQALQRSLNRLEMIVEPTFHEYPFRTALPPNVAEQVEDQESLRATKYRSCCNFAFFTHFVSATLAGPRPAT